MQALSQLINKMEFIRK